MPVIKRRLLRPVLPQQRANYSEPVRAIKVPLHSVQPSFIFFLWLEQTFVYINVSVLSQLPLSLFTFKLHQRKVSDYC